MRPFVIVLTLAAALTGCSQDQTNAPKTDDAACEASTCGAKITAEKASVYYSQFNYAVIGDCKEPKSLRFGWVGLFDRIVVGKSPANDDIVAELNLFMKDDGTYTGTYQENVQKLMEPGYFQTISTLNKKKLAGTWDLKDTNLTISDLGVAKPATVNNWPGFSIATANTTLNPILNGKSLAIAIVRSTVSKDLKTVAQYCTEAQ